MTFEVKGYTKTGIYAEVVEAATKSAALAKGKKLIKAVAFGKVLSWVVSEEGAN